MKKSLFALFLLAASSLSAQQRQEINLGDNWQFSRDQQQWQTVCVPHDWAISGPFDKKWDLQVVRIEQNGEKEASEKTGRSGALPWIGKGYYKRTFSIPQDFDGHAELLFDGAMAEPTVSVNGQRAGYWAYGYNTFRVDVTPFIKAGENALTVDLQNLEESSRWYPGAGIFRPVTLILTQKTHLDDWSLVVRTVGTNKGKTTVEAEGKVIGATKDMAATLTLTAPNGQTVGEGKTIRIEGDGSFFTSFSLENAQLWSPETPNLYTVKAQVVKGSTVIDAKTFKTGIRTLRVTREHGFQLNGQTRKLKGVCLHHDLGPLGAAVNKAALIRQVQILKEMGCDAIRTAHNMPSQMQMDVCDSLGMMVMAESFDMWIYRKCKNGYARFFREWGDKDITNLVLANRNHPSIVMWSIGNEIPEQWSEQGRQISIRLQGLCNALDPTRPVTQGMDRADNALSSGFAQAMQVPGFNYRVHKYQKNYEQLPQGFLLGSETASTVSSRGYYSFPVQPEAADNPRSTLRQQHYNGQCSGYDVQFCSWSNLPDDDWRWQDDKDWVIGEFVWTGFDYLGEPTPYDGFWPSRSSYFGICDLAGLPKDRYYLYRSKWNKEAHTIHLLPHWTWGKERKGELTPVYCYTDYPEAELFLNGKSQGRIKKVVEQGEWKPENRLDRYRLRWNEVRYEPGELRVVVYDEQGNVAGEKTLRTAGKPARLELETWTQGATASESVPTLKTAQGAQPALKADGNDLAFVTVSLLDKKGTLVPDAADQLRFEVKGAGTFRAVCNGDATSIEQFTKPTMKLFNGQLVVVVQAARQKGDLTLKVIDDTRKLSKTIVIPVR